jgi:hypothetical protein
MGIKRQTIAFFGVAIHSYDHEHLKTIDDLSKTLLFATGGILCFLQHATRKEVLEAVRWAAQDDSLLAIGIESTGCPVAKDFLLASPASARRGQCEGKTNKRPRHLDVVLNLSIKNTV